MCFGAEAPAAVMCWIRTTLMLTLSRTENSNSRITAYTPDERDRAKERVKNMRQKRK